MVDTPSPVPHADWAHVHCSAEERVTAIELAGAGLSGTLPPLTGKPHNNDLMKKHPISVQELQNRAIDQICRSSAYVKVTPLMLGVVAVDSCCCAVGLPMLQRVDLSNNNITGIEFDPVLPLPTLQVLLLPNNQLSG